MRGSNLAQNCQSFADDIGIRIIRRTMRIREGDPPDNSLTLEEKFAIAVHSILKRYKEQAR